ncbi:saccharopine dehydrogenase [Streptomyces anulatus]|uniref:saccharopine dehydrogenase n=1 Tax=Streptomyces anulatus TaxID=1892 RepID=UPI0036F97EB9
MTDITGIRLREEAAPDEERTPLVPDDAARLIAAGIPVTVEESARRIFPIAEYAAAGCRVVPGGSWHEAPASEAILGLKEPERSAGSLMHRHIFFGHAYKGQVEGRTTLRRFAEGGGTLLDLEYLTDEDGRRLAAFGYWAGYVGAALAVLNHSGRLTAPLSALGRHELDTMLHGSGSEARAVVIGALGRSGRGARDALTAAGAAVTEWDLDETRRLDREALLGHDILVNAVLCTEPGTPFLTDADLRRTDRALSVVSDVTCDVTSACHRLPVYDRITEWAEPVRRLHADPVLDLIAIDNLPSLLPRESSTDFSRDLTPHLLTLPGGSEVWDRCEKYFRNS